MTESWQDQMSPVILEFNSQTFLRILSPTKESMLNHDLDMDVSRCSLLAFKPPDVEYSIPDLRLESTSTSHRSSSRRQCGKSWESMTFVNDRS